MPKISTHKNRELVITQGFHTGHPAIDIGVSKQELSQGITLEGDPIYFYLYNPDTGKLYEEGVVKQVSTEYFYDGKLYKNTPWFNISLPDGKGFRNFHNSELVIEKGEVLKIGDLIGYSGNTGYSFGAHDHTQILANWRDISSGIDPSPFIIDININQMNIDIDKLNALLVEPIKKDRQDVLKNKEPSEYGEWWLENGQRELYAQLHRLDEGSVIISDAQKPFDQAVYDLVIWWTEIMKTKYKNGVFHAPIPSKTYVKYSGPQLFVSTK